MYERHQDEKIIEECKDIVRCSSTMAGAIVCYHRNCTFIEGPTKKEVSVSPWVKANITRETVEMMIEKRKNKFICLKNNKIDRSNLFMISLEDLRVRVPFLLRRHVVQNHPNDRNH